MRIICPKCGTEYFLESDQLDPEGTAVQCSACEHTFTVYGAGKAEPKVKAPPSKPPRPAAKEPAASVVPPPPPLPRTTAGGGALFLAQGDRIYKVKDHATLQRWIVEKRVLPGDRVSSDGKSWEVVSARADLRPFFAVIEQLKRAKRELRKRPTPVSPTPTDQPPVMFVSEDGAAVAPEAATAPGTEAPTAGPEEEATLQEGTTRGEDTTIRAPAPDAPAAAAQIADSPKETRKAMAPLAEGPKDTRKAFSPLTHPDETPVEDRLTNMGVGALDVSTGGALSTPQEPAEEGGEFESEEESFFGLKPGEALPEAPATMDRIDLVDPNIKDTRRVPVSNPTAPPPEVRIDEAYAANEARKAAVAGSARSADSTASIAPIRDFDPDQTFEEGRGGGPGKAFAFLALVGFAAAAFSLWHFLLGPGRPSPYTAALDGPTAEATPQPAPTAEPPPEAAGEEPAAATPSPQPPPAAPPRTTPTPKPTPRATPTPTPKPTPRATPTPRTAPRATPTPRTAPAPRTGRVDVGASLREAESAKRRGNYRAAAAAYERALEGDSSNFDAAVNLGWMYVELAENGSAIGAFRNALALRSSSAEAHYGLGLAYQARGQVQQAIAEYERALSLDPNGPDAREIEAILRGLKR